MKKIAAALTVAAALLAGTAFAQGQPQAVTATGTVKKIDASKRKVNLAHDAIPSINWPAMTMDFQVAPEVDLSAVKSGQNIEFTLMPAGKSYTITAVKPKG